MSYTFTAGINTTFDVNPLEINGGVTTPRPIQHVDVQTNTIRVLGDVTFAGTRLLAGSDIEITGSADNDGTYVIQSTTTGTANNTPYTEIELSGTLTGVLPWGHMTYAVPASTSLTIPGRSTLNYGEYLNSNLLQLLDNFCSATAPISPVEGQLWYSSTSETAAVYTGNSGDSFEGNTGWRDLVQNVTLPDSPDIIVAAFPPANPTDGTLLWNTTDNELSVWSDVAQTWYNITQLTREVVIDTASPQNPHIGLLWYNTTTDEIFIHTSQGWAEIYSSVQPLVGTYYFKYTATSSNISVITVTSFTPVPQTLTMSYQQVFRNGVLIFEGDDYVVNGVNITISPPLQEDETIMVYKL